MSALLGRRQLLERLAIAAGAVLVPLPFTACRSLPTKAPSKARTFDEVEWAIVEAATARLFPSDDDGFGAREANVVGYIDAQLAEPHFATFRREFEAGVPAIDLVSAARHGARFLGLAPALQDDVLQRIQSGEGSTHGFSSSHFFSVLFSLTLEGFLGDPAHGGNRGEVGWKLIGFVPGPPRPRS